MKSFQDRLLTFGLDTERLSYTPSQLYAKYYSTDTDDFYIWNGGAWILINGSGTGGMVQHANEWHTPDFTLANGAITGDTKTKITYDTKGLVTSGANATYTDVGAEQAGAVATHAGIATGIHGVGASNVESESGAASKVSTHAGEADPHTVYQKESEKGAISGYAGLDAASKVPTAQLGGAGASASNYLCGDQTWKTPPGGGGASELWEGKVHVAMFDGNPLAEPFMSLSNNTTISPLVTPTNIGIAVGRIVAFRFKTAITVTTIRWYGIASVASIYTAAIYRDSDGARLWSPTNVNTGANVWASNTADGLPITFAADTLYWFGIGADTIGTTAGFITPQLPKVAALGLANPAWAGLTTIGMRFCQVALTAGVFPATLPTKVNADAWTGFIPVFYLCASGY